MSVMSMKSHFTACSGGIVFLMVFLLPFVIPQFISSCHFFKNRWFVTLPFASCSILHLFLHSGGLCLIRRDHGSHVTNSSLVTSNTKATFHRSPLHFPQLQIRQSSIHSTLKPNYFCYQKLYTEDSMQLQSSGLIRPFKKPKRKSRPATGHQTDNLASSQFPSHYRIVLALLWEARA